MLHLNPWKKNINQSSKVSVLLFFTLSIPSPLFHFSLLLLMFWWAVWLPWFQMFLISQMPGLACNYTPTCYSISLMPHRAARTQTSTCTHTHTHIHKQSVHARVQSANVGDRAAAASCMRGETSCCLSANHGWSAKISTNQLCWGCMQEVSMTASRRKTQKHYEATR